VAPAHQHPAAQHRGELAAQGHHQRPGGEEERRHRQRSGQVMRDEEPDRDVGQHARESEGAGHRADLPVGPPPPVTLEPATLATQL